MKRQWMVWAVACVALLGSRPLCAEETTDDSYLYLVYNEGAGESDLSLGSLASLRSLTFSMSADAQQMNVNLKDGTVQTFGLDVVSRLYFSHYASGVEEVQATAGTTLYVQDGLLHTGAVAQGAPVCIYTVDGRLVKRLAVTGSPLPLDGLGSGLYVVRVNGVTCKFVK